MADCIRLEKRVVTESFTIRDLFQKRVFLKGEEFYLTINEVDEGTFWLFSADKSFGCRLRGGSLEGFLELTKQVEE